MSDMIDRMAMHIAMIDIGEEVAACWFESFSVPGKERYRAMARAALLQLLDPTDRVREALGYVDVGDAKPSSRGLRVPGSVCWRRGLEAALLAPPADPYKAAILNGEVR